ncbi:hypothetical protein EUU22_22305 [Ciceribacter ferrooxidans]|uniref:Uncharacterized protein n=1 Tax=Ciceribacter ferrooxidans TaxID=2509717 RepID=A0A4Q2S7F0_9HYPH|nr:hypothetical protein EUU22_22305 [Ciceribacter ferrooxidans]
MNPARAIGSSGWMRFQRRGRIIVTVCRFRTDAVVQAPAPPRLIRSGLPTAGTVAHVLVSHPPIICRSSTLREHLPENPEAHGIRRLSTLRAPLPAKIVRGSKFGTILVTRD